MARIWWQFWINYGWDLNLDVLLRCQTIIFGHLCLSRPVYSALNFSFEDLPTSLQQNWLAHQILRTRFCLNQLLVVQFVSVLFDFFNLKIEIMASVRLFLSLTQTQEMKYASYTYRWKIFLQGRCSLDISMMKGVKRLSFFVFLILNFNKL